MDETYQPPDDAIGIHEIVEPATMVEFTVPLDICDRPESALLRAVAEHLEELHDPVVIVSFQMTYVTEPHPHVLGILLTSGPIVAGGPLDHDHPVNN